MIHILIRFYVSVIMANTLTTLVHWFHLHNFVSSVRPFFRAHPKMRAAIFGCLHIVVSGVQLSVFTSLPPTLFLFSISYTLLTAFLFESPSANQNSFAADRFLFLTRCLLLHQSPVSHSFRPFYIYSFLFYYLMVDQ